MDCLEHGGPVGAKAQRDVVCSRPLPLSHTLKIMNPCILAPMLCFAGGLKSA